MPSSPTLEFVIRANDAPIVLTVGPVPSQGRSGCLVSFWSQCSIDPEAFVVWLSRANHTALVAEVGAPVALHLVPRGKSDLARWFGETSGDTVDTFASAMWEPGPQGVPMLTSLPDRIVGRISRIIDLGDSGDHLALIVTPLVVHLDEDPDDPTLLRLRDVIDFEPGHPIRA